MRAINKYQGREVVYRRWVVGLRQGKKVNRVVVSAPSQFDANATARVNHGGGSVEWSRLATAADMVGGP